jgi:crotonobetainyl-CoA:carnitine CoA-transferase CaiB-like acyl-CoA transferase
LRLRAPDGSRTATVTAAPHSVGEDTVDVLTSAGLSSDELAGLAEQGVI